MRKPTPLAWTNLSLLTLSLLLLFGTVGRSLAAQGAANYGFVWLNRALQVDFPAATVSDSAERAVRSFQHSATIDGGIAPHLAKGLGLIALHNGGGFEDGSYFEMANLDGEDLIAFGQQAENRDKFQAATAYYATATVLSPQLADTWYYLGRIYVDAAQYEAARSSLEQGLAAPNLSATGRADSTFLLGEATRLAGDQTGAAAYYQQALVLNDYTFPYNRVHTLDQLAAAYIQQEQFSSAVAVLEEAIALSPEFDWPHIRLGVALYGCCENYADAVASIEHGIALSPRNSWGYIHLGDVQAAEGRTAQARDSYEQALQLNPDWKVARERLDRLSR